MASKQASMQQRCNCHVLCCLVSVRCRFGVCRDDVIRGVEEVVLDQGRRPKARVKGDLFRKERKKDRTEQSNKLS